YDMPLSYFHTPLIIFAPGLLPEARASDVLGGQVDIFPTVMGILNVNYVNNTFGIDLLREARPAIFFTADDKIGCLNREFFLVHRQNGLESVYKYRTAESNNYLEQYPASADSLRTYAFSMLQAAQGMIEKKKTN
ncbi:MAG TPA: LTA synthase family protein, partial [bacterium]